MRLLITGGSGFIGRHLSGGLALEHAVAAPGHSELDLLDPGSVKAFLREGRFDVVIHAATWNATRVSDKDASLTLDHNLRMFFNLVREREAFGRLIHLGSGAEYSRAHWHGGMKEEEAGRHIPSDDYGLSKLLMGRYGESLPGVVNLRLFGVFGPHEDWRIRFISSNACRGLFNLPIRVKQDRRFDYLHVDDVLSAVRGVIASKGLEGTFNVCRGKGDRLSQIATMVLHALGMAVPVEMVEPGEGPEYSGDNGKILAGLPGWRPSDLEIGIRRQVEWLRQNRHLLDPDLLEKIP